MDVSVILVTYNDGAMVQACIRSVLAHTSADIRLEFIVVDNSEQFDVGPWLQEFEHLCLIRNQRNRGFAAANNQGLALATGRYTLLLNNDTLFIEDVLGPLIRFLETRTDPAFVACKLLNEDGTHQPSIVDFDTVWNVVGEYAFLWQLLPDSPLWNKFHRNRKACNGPTRVDVVKGAFLMAETQRLRQLNGFDEDFFFYNEENDLCYRHHLRGGQVWYLPEPAIIHLGGASAGVASWFALRNLTLSRLIYFKKHFPPLTRALLMLVHTLGYAVRVVVYALAAVFTWKSYHRIRTQLYARALFLYPS